ncbi:Gfo/Idh/MocA family protein [Chitinophaga pinensis]|uniref:Oxidoreductase domain protein n=1 Tax=Chitinophaga pinensis (strain ATCC 43595 / DSM 2588 / LMG 13176 / NBRC 15968 / NCIMB 11800 / UQM 2034) TaxID=485918 RepID=A0A979G717_CHIPD|nr:Gfo/Idh/MocA family oxidoreductase [Chitinophaga pinensis]ACU62109.1 oxidoreductase domain protein [Chitinophaga pinensis DSM 2588]
MNNSRRHFIRSASTLVAGAGLVGALPSALRAVAPSDKINVAAIGINGMGWSDLTAILKNPYAQCVALCDVDKNVLDKRAAELDKKGQKVKTYGDYRKLLEDKSIDAVIIGTPDHWHCLQMTDAVSAGKDVYVEKPIGNSIAEIKAMLYAQENTKRVVQVGQWQRSQQHFKDAIAFVHSGKLGQVRLVKAWAYMGWMHSIPKQPDGNPPAGVDYAAWLGPAQKRPFNPNRFHFNFRWYWDYAGGLMTDWGVHLLDYALLGMKAQHPQSVMAAGGKFAYPDDAAETPDTLTTVYQFDGFNIQWEHAIGIDGGPYGRDHGIAFIGNNGTLVLDRGGWEVIPEKDKMEAVPRQKSVDNGLDKHATNFLEVIKSRKLEDLNTPLSAGAHVATIAQLGNIAYKTSQKLHWNGATGGFTEKEANKYLTPEYHNGYKLPKSTMK